MKSYSRDEFLEYAKNLKFEELEDAATFVTEYYDYYKDLPENPKEEKDAAWEKYMILMAKFGILFVSFTTAVIYFRKKLNEEISAEANRSSGSLASGTD